MLASLFLLCMFSVLAFLRKLLQPLCPSLSYFWNTPMNTFVFVSATLFTAGFKSQTHHWSFEFWVFFEHIILQIPFILPLGLFVQFLPTTGYIHSEWFLCALFIFPRKLCFFFYLISPINSSSFSLFIFLL